MVNCRRDWRAGEARKVLDDRTPATWPRERAANDDRVAISMLGFTAPVTNLRVSAQSIASTGMRRERHGALPIGTIALTVEGTQHVHN